MDCLQQRDRYQQRYLLDIMTSATDSDIREIRTAVESISKATEANTKAIADLTISVTGLREEMRVGCSDIRGEIKEVRGKIDTSEAKLVGKIDKLDERTRLGFWGFVGRGLVLAILIALIPFVTRYLTSSLPEVFRP